MSSTSIRTPRGGRPSSTSLALLGAFALALVCTALNGVFTSDGVDEPQVFVAAVDKVKKHMRPRDVVLVHPPWRHDVVDALSAPGALPAGVTPTIALGLRHNKRAGRLWLVQDTGAPGLSDSMQARVTRAAQGDVVDHQGVRVLFLDDSHTQSTAQFTGRNFADALDMAEVSVETQDRRVHRCRFDGDGKHVCKGLPDWMWTGPTERVIRGRNETCVWSHPTTGGTVRVRFPNVKLQGTLQFQHAIADSGAGNPTGQNVVTSVAIDGKVKKRFTRTNQKGFSGGTVQLAGVDVNAPHSVELRITTANAGARHYCWRLTQGGR